jgi:diguanylate cyclase (GGDEF)-like protein
MSDQAVITYVGLLAQAAASCLLVALFLLLRAHARRRRYFQAWSVGWVTQAIALLALVLRYELFAVEVGGEVARGLPLRVLYLVYQLGKLGFLACVVAGTVLLVHGILRRRFTYALGAALFVYALLSVLLARSLDLVVLWQAPLVIAAAGFSAMRLDRLPLERRSLGTRVTAAVLVVIAGLWCLYVVAFADSVARAGAGEGVLRVVARFNSYLDLLATMVLAFGMVLILLEDIHRERDDAYAQLEVAYRRLRNDSLYDPLTGCLNRRALDERVGLQLMGNEYGTVALLDLDNLKEVNDRWGHLAGDRLLRHCAAVLRDGVRPTDRIYRVGGDEFLLLLRRGRAERVGPRIEELLAGAAPPADDPTGGALRLEVSLGCADYEEAGEVDAAIAAADAAMYEHKRGRKAVRAAAPERRRSAGAALAASITGEA